jgi:hypothetical protein
MARLGFVAPKTLQQFLQITLARRDSRQPACNTASANTSSPTVELAHTNSVPSTHDRVTGASLVSRALSSPR